MLADFSSCYVLYLCLNIDIISLCSDILSLCVYLSPSIEERFMRKKIPSSSSLQAFEAASRHGNFARAAEELSLTEGAISRQITRLESFLSCKLFDRAGNRIKLNPVGMRYAQQVREILERLERDTQYIKGMPEGSKNLEIASLPTFASRWLIPRLCGFRRTHPEITLNIAAKTEPFVITGSGFDAAVHFDHPAWAGMRMSVLFQETLIPVCHPSLLADKDAYAQLNTLPRIHRSQNPDAWQVYAQESGIVIDNPTLGARFDLHEMAISAALSGYGVALVPRIYIEKDLISGALVAPWPEAKSLKKNFFLVKPAETGVNDKALQIFEHWLFAEIANANQS